MIRSGGGDDFEAVARLYAQLNRDDPPVTGTAFVQVFEKIVSREGLDLLVGPASTRERFGITLR